MVYYFIYCAIYLPQCYCWPLVVVGPLVQCPGAKLLILLMGVDP